MFSGSLASQIITKKVPSGVDMSGCGEGCFVRFDSHSERCEICVPDSKEGYGKTQNAKIVTVIHDQPTAFLRHVTFDSCINVYHMYVTKRRKGGEEQHVITWESTVMEGDGRDSGRGLKSPLSKCSRKSCLDNVC